VKSSGSIPAAPIAESSAFVPPEPPGGAFH
jgi:hypothetical protein